ncbi:MAG: hypothetical protein JG775_689 [Defluviitaleaceae bacterium]|jgi:multiple sugar transport system substrate-binding protein|nr:hypothetical protein [Defluviitaleaceae bacterium]
MYDVCQHNNETTETLEIEMVPQYFGEKNSIYTPVMAPKDFDWRQCEGVVLNFLVENNINASVLMKEVEKFTEVTGIHVNIRSMDFDTLVERMNMEFISKSSQYELLYIDPYQFLTRFSSQLEDLNTFENNVKLPHLVGGIESFNKNYVDICSYFIDRDKLYAIPFDTTSMIFYYRKDIFEKYKNAMISDLNYNPVPGSTSFTWERYIEVAQWIDQNVPKSEIQYSSVSMSAEHNSIYCEFSNIMSAYGADYFADQNVNTLGRDNPYQLTVNTPQFREALSIYKRFVSLSPIGIEGINWSELAELFAEGKVAMVINWDENAAIMENESLSKVKGKVGYSILPYGAVRSANIYGGSGIGINANISEEKKLAAWLFIVWATSPQVQMKVLLDKEGGNMPSRNELYRLIEASYMAYIDHAYASISAQKERNAYYRPKYRNVYSFEKIMIDNLYNMIKDDLTPEETAQLIEKDWEKYSKRD